MNDEIITIKITKEEWLQALESGEYSQAHGGLIRISNQDSLSFCCLGVMCEMAPNATADYTASTWPEFAGYQIDGSDKKIIGNLEIFRPEWMSETQHEACMQANDELGWTFAQIAEWWRRSDGAVTALRNSKSMYDYQPDYTLANTGGASLWL